MILYLVAKKELSNIIIELWEIEPIGMIDFLLLKLKRWLLIIVCVSVCVCVYERKREKLICWIDKGSWPTFSFGERVGMKSSQEVLSPGRYASLSKPAQIWLRRFSCFLLPHKGMEADFNEPWRFKRLSHVLFLTPCSFILFDSKQGNWAASFLLPCCFGLNRKERNEAGNIDCL